MLTISKKTAGLFIVRQMNISILIYCITLIEKFCAAGFTAVALTLLKLICTVFTALTLAHAITMLAGNAAEGEIYATLPTVAPVTVTDTVTFPLARIFGISILCVFLKVPLHSVPL